jgi:hypothetical protein
MGRRLIAYVSVRDADGTSHRFAPGDEVPEWAASYLSNPDVWDDSSQVSNAETGSAVPNVETAPAVPEPAPEPAPAATAPATQAPEQAPVGTPPPRGGKGSGRTAWVRYAEANGLDTDEFDDRDELIAELRRRGIPVD